MKTVQITYFSDVLCVWAYIAQLRIDAIERAFGERVSFDIRFCSVFGDTARKIAAAWGAKGGYDGFQAHLLHAAEAFPEVSLNPDIWRVTRPASSMSPHLFLKAAQLAEAEGSWPGGAAAGVLRAMRAAFFEEARDVARWDVQCEIARAIAADTAPIEALIRRGEAHAALATDYKDADEQGIQGSPSFVLNAGRQKLYGNVGFKIIEANIQELLRDPNPDNASWC
jgi:predicted DsbA family dithiol-disulfide isomerase